MTIANLETIIDLQSWCRTWPPNGSSRIRAKEKLLRKHKGAFKSSWSQIGSPKSFTLTVPCNLAKLVKLFLGIIVRRHHRSETKRIAERAVRRIKEGTSAVLLQSGLDGKMVGGFHGKTPYERRFGVPFEGQIVPFGAMVEYHSISAAVATASVRQESRTRYIPQDTKIQYNLEDLCQEDLQDNHWQKSSVLLTRVVIGSEPRPEVRVQVPHEKHHDRLFVFDLDAAQNLYRKHFTVHTHTRIFLVRTSHVMTARVAQDCQCCVCLKTIPSLIMSLLDVPFRPFPPIFSSPTCSLTRPSASSTPLRQNFCATPPWRGMSGHLANPIPDTGYEPKFCIDVSNEHTPINLTTRIRNFPYEYDATIATTEDLDLPGHS